MTERLHFHFSLSCIGEGNGNPLQGSCLENPRDGGAWWAAFYGMTQSWTPLKRRSSSSSRGSLWPKTERCGIMNTLTFLTFIKVMHFVLHSRISSLDLAPVMSSCSWLNSIHFLVSHFPLLLMISGSSSKLLAIDSLAWCLLLQNSKVRWDFKKIYFDNHWLLTRLFILLLIQLLIRGLKSVISYLMSVPPVLDFWGLF